MQLNFSTFFKSNQWLKLAIFSAVLVLFALLFWFGKQAYENYQKLPDIYVSSNYQGKIKLGLEKYPYNDFSKALAVASSKKLPLVNVHLKNGEYFGNFEIPENVKIFGESRESVIFKGERITEAIVIMGNDSSIFNLTVNGGTNGILAKGRAEIENCSISGAKQGGITMTPLDSEIFIKNSEIYDNGAKGIYITKGRKISITGNKIHNNRGEGLDIRDKVSGIISNNEIYNNTESGIEFIVGGSSLDIAENNIWGNEAGGITAQYYDDSPEKGQISIHKNRIQIENPEKFTISVKSPSGGEGRVQNYWRDSITIANDNILEGRIKTRSLEITNNK